MSNAQDFTLAGDMNIEHFNNAHLLYSISTKPFYVFAFQIVQNEFSEISLIFHSEYLNSFQLLDTKLCFLYAYQKYRR